MYAYENISWSEWKAKQTALSATVYYIQSDFEYQPFFIENLNSGADKTQQYIWRHNLIRTPWPLIGQGPNFNPAGQSTDPNVADFETNYKSGATKVNSIADALAAAE